MTNLKTIKLELSNFTQIDLRGAGEINLTQAPEFSFEMSAEDHILDMITTEIEDETLIIGFERHTHFHSKEKIVYNISMPVIAKLRISGGGSLNCARIAGKSFVLDLPGGANVDIGSIAVVDCRFRIPGSAKLTSKQIQAANVQIDMPGTANIVLQKLDTDNLTMNVQGAGNISLAGRVISQSINVPGVAHIDAGKLQSDVSSIRSFGMGNVTVWVNDVLDAIVGGVGNVKYYGNPRVKKSSRGFTSIKRIGDAPLVTV